MAGSAAHDETLPADNGQRRSSDVALSTTAADLSLAFPALQHGVARGTTIGRYVILGVLGRGGMGVVYAAFDPELDRKVAVKVLRPELAGEAAAARLMREGRAVAKLAHPNVVTVFDVGDHNGSVFVAMELVDGTALDRWIEETQRPWREVVAVLLQAGAGLAAAHAAGIVHRDFKPANVLMGKDGRARVTDFGLARFDNDIVEAKLADVPANSSEEVQLTRTGAVLGTPAYMSPEQFNGEGVDARSDQFGFAVALYEALYGERPFEGTTVDAILINVEAHAVRPAPANARVPGWLRQVILRALRGAPNERFPSLATMLEQLRRDPAQRRRRAAVATASLAALALGVGVAATGHDDAAVCAGARPKLERVWTPALRVQSRAAFEATGKPYATFAWQSVEQMIDRYADAWVGMHVDACEATNVRREQSVDVLDLRTECLDRRLQELRITLDVFAHADAAVVENANKVATHLADVAACADVDNLRARVPLPASSADRTVVAGLREQVARAFVLSEAGKFREALAFAPGIVRAARSIGYRPVESEALRVLGDLQGQAGDHKSAERSLDDAVVAAEAAGDQLAAGKAWTDLVTVVGLQSRRYKDALRLSEHARAILSRVEPGGLTLAGLDQTLSGVYREDGQYTEARAAVTRALKVFERLLPPGSSQRSRAYNGLANIDWVDGHLDAALAKFQRVKTELEKSLGPQHPLVGLVLGNIANVLGELGRRDESLATAKHQLAVELASLGPDHPEMVSAYNKLGTFAADAGRWEDALTYYGRALALGEQTYGPAHPKVNLVLTSIALLEIQRGRLEDARAHMERVLRNQEALHGADTIETTKSLQNLANIDKREGKLQDSKQKYERVLEIRRKALGVDHADVADAYIGLSNIEAAQGHDDLAIISLKRALTIQEKALGSENPRLAVVVYNLATAYHGLSRWREAEVFLTRARTLLAKRYGPDHPYTAAAMVLSASTLDELGRTKEALSLARAGLAIYERSGGGPQSLAEARDTLARLLWRVPEGDRVRAKALAREALAGYTLDTPAVRERRNRLSAWMRDRKIAP